MATRRHCPDEHTENLAYSLLLRKKKILMHVKDVHSAYVESVYGTTWTGESYTHAVQHLPEELSYSRYTFLLIRDYLAEYSYLP